jgi:hypothetical protein
LADDLRLGQEMIPSLYGTPADISYAPPSWSLPAGIFGKNCGVFFQVSSSTQRHSCNMLSGTRVVRSSSQVNFQVTVLKILAGHPDGWASMADLKRDMAILATSGREWSERTTRLAAGFSDLSIFGQGMVARIDGGWRITEEGRRALALMECLARAATAVPVQEATATLTLRSHPLGSADHSSLAVRNQRWQIRCRRRRAAATKKELPKGGG